MITDGASVRPNRALWEKGDFTRIAATMRTSAMMLVAELGISEGLEVLDVGCGDGTTALPAAMLGAVPVDVVNRQRLRRAAAGA